MESTNKLLWTWYIDPWKREACPLQIDEELSAWRQAIQSDELGIGVIEANDNGREIIIDVWCDDNGRYRNPDLPTFNVGHHWVFGYALLFERAGENTVSVGFDAEFLINDLRLQFESWEERLNPDDYVKQMLRVIELEPWFRGRWKREQQC